MSEKDLDQSNAGRDMCKKISIVGKIIRWINRKLCSPFECMVHIIAEIRGVERRIMATLEEKFEEVKTNVSGIADLVGQINSGQGEVITAIQELRDKLDDGEAITLEDLDALNVQLVATREVAAEALVKTQEAEDAASLPVDPIPVPQPGPEPTPES